MLRYFLSFLLPNYCHICGKKTNSISVLCDDCIPSGGLRLVKRDIINDTYPDIAILSALPYDEKSKFLLHSIKFEEKRFFIEDILRRIDFSLLASFLKAEPIDFITYVPLPFCRVLRRGFNQSRIISKVLAKNFGVKCFGFMKKKQYAVQSRKKDKSEREKIISNNPFYLRKRYKRLLSRIRGILLIDDLITTGSTLRAFIDKCKEVNSSLRILVFTLFYTE